MSSICDKCGKEYYSETEYEQHLYLHQLSELANRAADSNANLGKQIDSLNGNIQIGQVMSLSVQKGIPFEEAVELYFAYKHLWTRMVMEQKAKDESTSHQPQ